MTGPDPQDVQALGWTLLHFLWQGAALAVLLAGLDRLLRHAAPQARYALASAVLGVMAILPVATFEILRASDPSDPVPLVTLVPTAERSEAAAIPTGGGGGAVAQASLRDRVEPLLPLLVGLWCLGVFVSSLRTLGGFALVQRLKRTGIQEPPSALRASLERLRASLGVSSAVRLYESALVQVPTVLGWLRPVILVPASALSGLTVEQLELILAHELAHIRRRDYLVNLLQTAAETLLFYHPAVWWVSHRMRVERELCCDDLAVAACGSPVRYARALADLQGLCAPPPALAMAATAGSLLERVARLLTPPGHLSRASRGLAALLVAGSLALAVGLSSALVGQPQLVVAVAAQPPVPEEEEERKAVLPTPPPPPPAAPVAIVAPSFSAEPVLEATPPPEAPEVNEVPPTPLAPLSLTPPPPAPPATSAIIALPTPVAAHPAMAHAHAAIAGASVQAASSTPPPPPTGAAKGSRAFPLERIIALARSGVTPEYVDAMDAAGFGTLSAEQLIALRNQGVGPEYVKGMKEAGYPDLDVEKLVALRAQGVTPEWLAGMKAAGMQNLSVSDALSLRAQGVSPDFIAEMKKAGYADLSVSKLLALRSQGVSGQYVGALKELGYADLSTGKLMALRAQGVTPDYVRGMAEAGYTKIEVSKLLALRAQGVTPDYVRSLKDAGLANLEVGDLIQLRAAGVTAEFIREMKEAGLDPLRADDLIQLRHSGVRPELLKRLKGRL